MAALLLYMMPLMEPLYGGSAFERVWSLAILVAVFGAGQSRVQRRRRLAALA